MNDNPIDLTEFLERVQDDKDLLLELLDIFQEDYQEKRRGLGDAAAKKDLEGIKTIAHSLKGASGNISARGIHTCCLKIEQAAKAGDANISEQLILLDQCFSEVQGHIERIKKDFGK